jgi:proteic killer suppression protein
LSLITQSVIILPVAIRTFKCSDTEALFRLRRVARFANIKRPALRKLKQFDLARRFEDLRAPPANRLEQLKGDRAGQWSLRRLLRPPEDRAVLLAQLVVHNHRGVRRGVGLLHPLVQRSADQDLAGLPQPYRVPWQSRACCLTRPRFLLHPRSPK